MISAYGENPNTAVAVNLSQSGAEMNATQALVSQKIHLTSVRQIRTY
jgi:hypothetical protein